MLTFPLTSYPPPGGRGLLFLHLVDDDLYVGCTDLAVSVQVVLHVLACLRLLHLVDDNLYAGCRVGCLSSN